MADNYDIYKAEKEAFVTGMTGSSIGHVNMFVLTSLLSVALHSAARTRLPPLHFPVEVILIAGPLLLSVTIFANSPALLSFLLAVTTALLLILPRRESGTYLPSSLAHPHSRQSSRASSPSRSRDSSPARTRPVPVPQLPALSTYRAHMLLLTAVCILAVDFPVFPRSFAKCETFGVSIMDLGVGSFVFSQGVVAAIPLVKNPSHLTAPLLPKVATVLRKSSPVLLLGLFRTVSVKGTEYPEHVTEYGVHWNFFITLALIPVMQVLLHPFMVYIPISLLGVVVAISHQLALSTGHLADFILHAPRDTVLSANKEGIISLTGYLAIHLLGLSTGTLVLAPSPSYFRRRQQQLTRSSTPSSPRQQRPSPHESDSDSDLPSPTSPRPTSSHPSSPSNPSPPSFPRPVRRENDKTATELCSYAVLWWVFLGILTLLGTGGAVSRRMVNLPYVAWIAAVNATALLAYLVLDIMFFPSPLSTSVYSPTSKLKVHPDPRLLSAPSPDGIGARERGRNADRDMRTGGGSAPALLEAVNQNGLVLFLLANVATGLINLSLPTMYMSDWGAMLVLSVYTFGLSTVAWVCRHRKIWRF